MSSPSGMPKCSLLRHTCSEYIYNFWLLGFSASFNHPADYCNFLYMQVLFLLLFAAAPPPPPPKSQLAHASWCMPRSDPKQWAPQVFVNVLITVDISVGIHWSLLGVRLLLCSQQPAFSSPHCAGYSTSTVAIASYVTPQLASQLSVSLSFLTRQQLVTPGTLHRWT